MNTRVEPEMFTSSRIVFHRPRLEAPLRVVAAFSLLFSTSPAASMLVQGLANYHALKVFSGFVLVAAGCEMLVRLLRAAAPGELGVENGTLIVRTKSVRRIAPARVLGAVFVPERNAAVIQLKNCVTIEATIASIGAAEELVSRIATRAPFELTARGKVGRVVAAFLAWMMIWITTPVLLIVTPFMRTLGPLSALRIIFTLPLIAGVLAAWRVGRKRVAVGPDGLRITGVWRDRFIPIDSIIDVRGLERGAMVVLRGGERIVISLFGQPTVLVQAFTSAIAERRERFEARRVSPAATLARNGRSLGDWRRDLGAFAANTDVYREQGRVDTQLEEALVDPSLPLEVRVGASLALSGIGPEAGERMRVAVETIADPEARSALLAVAEENDDAVEEALRKAPGVG